MSSTYCTESDINNLFGSTNVQNWADLDNDDDATVIAARITAAIAFAGDYIDDVMRGAHYTVPLQDQAGSTPGGITNLAATLAGLWLYEARGSQDFDPKTGRPYHRLAFRKMEARRALREYRDGIRRPDAI